MRHLSIILTGLILLPTLMMGPVKADSMAWTNDQAMLIFFEATTQIKKHGLDSDDSSQITIAAIKAYMNHHDPYGDYLSVSEYQQWKQAQQYNYYGIGIEIVKRDDHFYCMPKAMSPARTAGIQQGDELLKVDNFLVTNKSIYSVGSRIRGKINSIVKLTVIRDNILHKFSIKRSPLKDISVWLSRQDGLDVLRISHFSTQTFEEIKKILQARDQNKQLILDLRDNPGGDLFSAIDIAGLFLPEGSRIMTIKTKKGKVDYTAKGRLWKGQPLAIWQNKFTASASEVLIAGLTENNMATSFGTNSYGKAMTQSVIELSDGSALIISRGILAGPGGNSWQNIGLKPRIKIQDTAKSWAQITLKTLN